MLNKLKDSQKEVRKEVRERTLAYVVAALGLVAGLAWNEAINTLIAQFFPLSKDTLIAKFVYAGVITIIVVTVSSTLVRVLGRQEDKK
ncbi:MAG: DUF5654 family protein [Patescibacteria group bacterium]